MSDWALGKKLNSHIADVPLNHLIWLNDYKTYGENSYVFNDKDILHELYASPIAANDRKIFAEALDYCAAQNKLGHFILSAYNHRDERDIWGSINAPEDCVSRLDVLNSIASDIQLMEWFQNNQDFKNAITDSTLIETSAHDGHSTMSKMNVLLLYVDSGYSHLYSSTQGAMYYYAPHIVITDYNSEAKYLYRGSSTTASTTGYTEKVCLFCQNASIGNVVRSDTTVDRHGQLQYIQLSKVA